MTDAFSQAIKLESFTTPDIRAEAAVTSIMSSAFPPAYGEAWTGSQISSFMLLPGVRLTLASLDRAWLGFTLTRQVLDEVELMLIATDRKWQNRGIGKILLSDSIAAARKSRSSTIHLEVRANNSAVHFYENHGFELVHRRPAYYKGNDGTYYDALSLLLRL